MTVVRAEPSSPQLFFALAAVGAAGATNHRRIRVRLRLAARSFIRLTRFFLFLHILGNRDYWFLIGSNYR